MKGWLKINTNIFSGYRRGLNICLDTNFMNPGQIVLNVSLLYPLLPLITAISGTNTRGILEDFDMFFYVVSTIHAEIVSLLRICSRCL